MAAIAETPVLTNADIKQINIRKAVKKEKYIGSVRFFKHLILSTLALMIIIPWVLFAVMAVKYGGAKDEIAAMEQMLDSTLMENQGKVTEENIVINLMPDSQKPAYQQMYPDFYAPQALSLTEYSDKTIYLTFDDGPSPRTAEILSILEEKGVKATFFVVGQSDEQSFQWMRDIVEAGHTIGMHTYTHDYKKVYASVESYLEDMYRIFSQIKEVTGVAPTVFRFPGGSINAYNTGINQEIISEMLRRGFVPYDWNISSEDAATTPPAAPAIVASISRQAQNVNRGVVLMHDSDYKFTTVEALPQIIDDLSQQGFSFSNITPDMQPVVFSYKN